MQTSDPAQLATRIDLAIQANPYLARRHLEWETHAGHVTLRGVVGSYYQKQMAQESLKRVDGVVRIENLLEVIV